MIATTATEAVQLGPEHLTDADKKYIASEFVRSLYQIDPATRSKDIERALRMMLPDSALKFARYLLVLRLPSRRIPSVTRRKRSGLRLRP